MPTKAGERITTDRSEALHLARLARAGALTVVDVPQGHEAARRDLTRARDEALRDRKDAHGRLHAFGRRHDLRSTGRAHGGPAPLRWRSAGRCPTPTPPRVLPDYVRAVQEPPERRQRLAPARHEPVHAGRVSPGVAARQAWRGVPGTVAVPLRAAMGARPRLATPRDLRPCVGVPPSAYASGAPRRQGAMPTAGPPLPEAGASPAPGPLASPRKSADMGHCAAPHPPTSSRTSVGTRKRGWGTVPGASGPEANTPLW